MGEVYIVYYALVGEVHDEQQHELDEVPPVLERVEEGLGHLPY